MIDITIMFLFVFSVILIIYHHVIYPFILGFVAKYKYENHPDIKTRKYVESKQDDKLKEFSIVIPAFNEAKFIAEKIRNLSFLDYPNEKFELILLCDGCSDETYHIASEALEEIGCYDLNYKILNFEINRGKVAVIKEGVKQAKFDNIVFSDVSALLPVNALLMLDTHFNNKEVGAVSGAYQFANKGTIGEQRYWNYQSKLKIRESLVASVLGAHGAFYAIKRSCYMDIPENTINDDFLIPMNVIKQGYRVVYDPRVAAIELEKVDLKQDMKRRLRISAGNFQQLLYLLPLINPKYGWNAVNFASGKALRAIIPFLFLFIFFSSIYLFSSYLIFQLAVYSQVVLYGGVLIINLLDLSSKNALVKIVCYLVNGYWVALIGALKYILGLQQKTW